jgi:hypothetical protein
VTDQLFLSIWLERHARANRQRHFHTLLQLFPFSQREQPQSQVSIHAVDSTEPPLLERPVNGPLDIEEVMEIFAEYKGEDVAYQLESWWDVWLFKDDWKVTPARISLACFGPEFDNGTDRPLGEQEDMRIDFGVDTPFLPQPEVEGSPRMVQSNIKSMLRLVHEIDSALPVSTRRLATESGENFAERLQQALVSEGGSVQ